MDEELVGLVFDFGACGGYLVVELLEALRCEARIHLLEVERILVREQEVCVRSQAVRTQRVVEKRLRALAFQHHGRELLHVRILQRVG